MASRHPNCTPERLTVSWPRVSASRPARVAARRWARTEPALAGFESPAEIVEWCHQAPTADTNDIGLALVRLTAAGDELAARSLLQIILPGLVAAAVHHLRSDATLAFDDACDDIIAHAYLGIATYPRQRARTHVIVNLIRHAERDAKRHRHRDRRLAPITDTIPIAAVQHDHLVEVHRPTSANDDLNALDDLLIDGLRAGTLGRRDAEIAARAGLYGQTQTEIGVAVGLSDRQIRRTLTRLQPQLAAAHQDAA